jgi:hypothetical protein
MDGKALVRSRVMEKRAAVALEDCLCSFGLTQWAMLGRRDYALAQAVASAAWNRFLWFEAFAGREQLAGD